MTKTTTMRFAFDGFDKRILLGKNKNLPYIDSPVIHGWLSMHITSMFLERAKRQQKTCFPHLNKILDPISSALCLISYNKRNEKEKLSKLLSRAKRRDNSKLLHDNCHNLKYCWMFKI